MDFFPLRLTLTSVFQELIYKVGGTGETSLTPSECEGPMRIFTTFRHQRSLAGPVVVMALTLLASWGLMQPGSAEARDKWYPLEVDVWDPPFNEELKRHKSSYVALEKASKKWRLCVSIPHLKDPYWSAVNFGLIDEAKRLGVGLRLLEAGGYDHLDNQRKQIADCMSSNADALIYSAISADGLNDLVEKYIAKGKPVIDMINGSSSKKVTARAGVNFYDPGFAIGQYARTLFGKTGNTVNAAWFPGPDGATWVSQADSGFRAALEGSSIKIVSSAKGDTGRVTQGGLIRAALDEHPDIQMIAGTTVTAEAAVEILRRRGLDKKVKVLAFYYGPGIHRGIRRGSIVAAPTDLQAIQARMSVDLAVRALEGKPLVRHVAPGVIVIDRDNIRKFDASTTLPPRGFRPIFSINDW
jgi:periplasmic protein TorT